MRLFLALMCSYRPPISVPHLRLRGAERIPPCLHWDWEFKPNKICKACVRSSFLWDALEKPA